MSLNENEMGYSFEWSPYRGYYDKYEYDIKTKSGVMYSNCYPNAGKFRPNWNGEPILEEDIAEVRISVEPKLHINPKRWYDKDYKGTFKKWEEKDNARNDNK